MSRLGQYSVSLIERLSAKVSGLNLAILLAFTTLGGVALFFVVNRATERFVTIFDGQTFSRVEVERIEAAFYDADLQDYRFVDNRLEVSFDDRHQYVKVLNDGALLSNGFHGALSEAIQNSSILDSSRKTELKNQLAIGNDTGKLLCRMSEIQNAFVHFLEEPLPGLHRRKKITASVIVECKTGNRLTDANIQGIRSLIKTLRPGLSENGITVTEFSDQKMTVHAAGNTVTEKTGLEKRVAVQQQYERHWERKVREAVDYIPAARITVTAKSATELPDNTEESNSSALRPTNLGVLINIPTSYYHRVWQAKAAEAGMKGKRRPTYDDLRRLRLQIEDKIASNVRTLTAAHENSEVTVTSFADDVSDATEVASELTDLNLWKFIGFLVVVILIISAFHIQTKRSAKSESDRATIPHETNWEMGPATTASASTDVLRKQISDVIREDPETAAQVLGEWMKKAG